jgi:DNA-binding transcriptional MerR regulator
MLLKVGEVAKKTGMSVRALHHYDEIGLLSPSHRSEAGYRLYTLQDLLQLQKIKSLSQLGFTLEAIKNILKNAETPLLSVLQQHIQILSDKIEQQQVLIRRLQKLANTLEQNQEPSITLIYETLKETIMFEKYYTEDQLNTLSERKKQFSANDFKQVEQEWQDIFNQFTKLFQEKKPASCPEAQELAKRSQKLISMFTGGDPAMEQSLKTMYETEGADRILNQDAQGGMNLDPAVFAYFQEACNLANAKS